MIRRYAELRRINSFEERFAYLKLNGVVGKSTFGFDRWVNQAFYTSAQWRQVRHEIIVRDNGCDLGVEGHELHERIIIHHMNPMAVLDIESGDPAILDPEFLISVSHATHNAIHYGDESLLPKPPVERRPGDTNLWS
jgi:hypothetical protein